MHVQATMGLNEKRKRCKYQWINLYFFAMFEIFAVFFCCCISSFWIADISGKLSQYHVCSQNMDRRRLSVEIVTNSCIDILIDKQSEMAITISHQWWQRLIMCKGVLFHFFLPILFIFYVCSHLLPNSFNPNFDSTNRQHTAFCLLIWDLKFIIPKYVCRSGLNSSVIIPDIIGIITYIYRSYLYHRGMFFLGIVVFCLYEYRSKKFFYFLSNRNIFHLYSIYTRIWMDRINYIVITNMIHTDICEWSSAFDSHIIDWIYCF